jgi:HlyD family secretion protein
MSAERDLARLRGVADRNTDLVSLQALDEAETAVEVQEQLVRAALFGTDQAQAALEEAEDQLFRTTIRAPIAGRVIRLSIEEGETAVIGTMNNPGSLLLTIGDLSVIEAVMAVDETDVPRIVVGDSAVIDLDAFPGKFFAARVSSIGNSAIQGAQGAPPAASTGGIDFEVILTLTDPPPELRPDLSATADIIVEERDNVLAVPIISVTMRSDEDGDEDRTAPDEGDEPTTGPLARSSESRPSEGVFVVREGAAVWTPVILGITGQEYFEVRSGLSEGDVVVSGPYRTIQLLEDGDGIRLSEDSSEP